MVPVDAPLALRRALTNLIDNAVNYGYCAKICVEDSNERLIIRILDQGPGIPEDRLAFLRDLLSWVLPVLLFFGVWA